MNNTTHKPLVMVVEDDQLLADLVARKFNEEKIEAEYAKTGEEALKLLEKERAPDLVLLDIRLPGIDGFEVLKQLRANEATKDTKVFIFSNFGEDEDVNKAKQLGANRFIVKVSLSLDEVTTLVQATLDSKAKKME